MSAEEATEFIIHTFAPSISLGIDDKLMQAILIKVYLLVYVPLATATVTATMTHVSLRLIARFRQE
jgi:hypothetical protein